MPSRSANGESSAGQRSVTARREPAEEGDTKEPAFRDLDTSLVYLDKLSDINNTYSMSKYTIARDDGLRRGQGGAADRR